MLDYQDAWQLQQRIAADVRAGADDTLILLEHPPTYTLGARGNTEHLLLTREAYARRGASVVQSDRGGDVTFHGPGQLVGYPIIDLRGRHEGALWYVGMLEQTMIDALHGYGIDAGRRDGARGVWCGNEKIAAIGVRVSRGVTMHGFALNVQTDLSYFDAIVPCGIRDGGVTSMAERADEMFEMPDVMRDVASAFGRVFGYEIVDGAGWADGRADAAEATSLRRGFRGDGVHHEAEFADRGADAAEATSLRGGFRRAGFGEDARSGAGVGS